MPKNKTHSGASKRFKVTGSGKLAAREVRHCATTWSRRPSQDDPPHERHGRGRQGRRQARQEAARPLTPRSRLTPELSTHKEYHHGTRQAGSERPQEAPDHPRARQRLPRPALAPLPQGQGAGHPLAGLQLPRPQGAQGRLPQALDPADQRRGPRQRHDLQPLHPGPHLAGVEVDRKILADLAVNDAPAFAALVETAKAALPEDVNAPEGLGLTAPGALTAACPLTAGTARVKEARKLSRRSVRIRAAAVPCRRPEGRRGRPRGRAASSRCSRPSEATEQYAALVRGRAAGSGSVDDRALASLSDTVTPAGVVAVCSFLDVPARSALATPAAARLVAICADVRDPGNAGTVVRTADAAGADAVVLAGHSVDPYNPKTVRASVGSLFHLPSRVEPDPAAAVARRAGRRADRAGRRRRGRAGALDDAGDLLGRPTAWLFGNEAWGLPAELAALADHRVRIPIHGRAESLNLSTAAALCLYAASATVRSRVAVGRSVPVATDVRAATRGPERQLAMPGATHRGDCRA